MAIASRHIEHAGFTVEDVLALPEDGLRYELFDGMLIVNPPPTVGHQVVLAALLRLFEPHLVGSQRALPAPIGWRPERPEALERWFEPDVVVVDLRPGDLESPHLTTAPLLVVEVLSPSTKTFDRHQKRLAYEEGGVGAYWLVDPSPTTPTVTVLERPSAREPFVEVAYAVGTEVARATHPWPVEVVPAELVR